MSIIHFLNVKEGDCTWIQHETGHNTIVDISNGNQARDEEKILESVRGNLNRKEHPINPIEYLKSYDQKEIFRFILTHPDMDHIDGLKNLFNNFDVINFWDTDNKKSMDENSNCGSYKKEDWEFYQSIRKSQNNPTRLNLYAGARGKYYNEGENNNGDSLYILAPTRELIKEANDTKKYNDCSYVILHKVGNKKVIFAGDSEKKTWDYILENHRKDVENIDLLIAPHHGRKTGRKR